MTAEPTRLTIGARTIDDASLETLVAFIRDFGHVRLTVALLPIVMDEQRRRAAPADFEPAWPAIDLSTWTAADLFWAIHELNTMSASSTDQEVRAFTTNAAATLLIRLAAELSPLVSMDPDDVYARAAD